MFVLEEYFILDVRTEREFDLAHIPGSVNIPHRKILVTQYPGSSGLALKRIPMDKKIILFCGKGRRACLVEKVLNKLGYDVLNLLRYEHAEDYVSSLRELEKEKAGWK